ncbi:hypothetical protein [Pontibacter diazotrophicus]|uniref:hypothetical protein n=1 Tax=Pontibacter diazotrophicus TaxID=1400979 RepID=UPI0015F1B57D|nr:hypothetical protein [Pontibacter diazotrophicus]
MLKLHQKRDNGKDVPFRQRIYSLERKIISFCFAVTGVAAAEVFSGEFRKDWFLAFGLF